MTRRPSRSAPLILVTNDVEETRDGTADLLESDGYRVAAARSEEDAVEQASRLGADLILVTLPGLPLDVVAAGTRIRRRAQLSERVPVVIFCCPLVEEGAEAAVGDNVFVTRPDNFDQLRSLIKRLLWRAPRTR